MKIGVITAMSSELNQLVGLLSEKKESKIGVFNFIEGKINENDIILMQSGIGKVNATAGTIELIHKFNPDCIISSGCAGGIDTCLSVMDIVVSKQLVYHDVWCGEGEWGQIQGMPAYYEGNETLLKCAMELDTETRIFDGLMCTGDRFVTDRKELEEIKSKFPNGLAVDMESCAIAQVCYLYHVPFISFRIVSDTPGADNHAEQYANFWQDMANRSFKVTETFLCSLPNKL